MLKEHISAYPQHELITIIYGNFTHLPQIITEVHNIAAEELFLDTG
ncbi:hypothetical protein SpAn4DRAFT_4853 [Sporomusa ovata]|uniref:Uncharacterized protein n=1 Tax=Sporomusa ovata TaxID=2378 RepID=A0A0U1KRE4_9FIRM|nr:hypothetical protein SpAn4DRAFT_4853 [Sporomusa ovata]